MDGSDNSPRDDAITDCCESGESAGGSEGDKATSKYFSLGLTIRAKAATLKSMLNYRDVDSSFRALAEPTRRAIVERLSRGPATVSDLAAPFAMTFAAVVQHLQVLEACGLIRSGGRSACVLPFWFSSS